MYISIKSTKKWKEARFWKNYQTKHFFLWKCKFVSPFKIAVFCIACVQKCPHFLQVQGKKLSKPKKSCICQGTVLLNAFNPNSMRCTSIFQSWPYGFIALWHSFRLYCIDQDIVRIGLRPIPFFPWILLREIIYSLVPLQDILNYKCTYIAIQS